jgi:hypothetical protein
MRQVILGGTVAVLLLAGCSGDDGATSEQGASTTTAAVATPAAAAEIYVVQEAGAATLGAAGDGDARTLTLSDARDRSLTFMGGSSPQARSVPTAEVVDALGVGDARHEAALSWSSPTGTGAIAVTLVSGAYDPAAGTLTYEVIPLDPSDAGSAVVAARATTTVDGEEGSLPEGITTSTLFIDPIDQDQAVASCNLTIENQSELPAVVTDISSSDKGGMVDWDRPLTEGQALPAGGQITAESGDSAWDCHADVTIELTSRDGDTFDVYLSLRDPVFSTSTWSCQSNPDIGCDIDANAKGQPLDMTVTIWS